MKQELWDARIDALRAYEQSGLTAIEVAKQVGLTPQTVGKHARNHGIVFRTASMTPLGVSLPRARVEFIRQLATEGKTRREVAGIVGLRYSSVTRIAVKHEIDFKHGSEKTQADDRAEAMAAMFVSGKTLAEIGAIFGVTRERIRQVISKYYGMTRVDGGARTKADRRVAQSARKRDEKYLRTRGCTFAEYQGLVEIGRQITAAGGTRERTPIGAFASQRANAKSRDIEWKISLWDWWTIWQRSGKWEQRGRCKHNYVMCRFGDSGIYEPSNVYIATASHNGAVQPNNPYRKDHPDHERAVAAIRHKLTGSRSRESNKPRDLPTGVVRHKNKFQAQIGVRGKTVYLGRYATPEEAHQAYLAAVADLEMRVAA